MSDVDPEKYFRTLKLGMKCTGVSSLNRLTRIMYKTTEDTEEKEKNSNVVLIN